MRIKRTITYLTAAAVFATIPLTALAAETDLSTDRPVSDRQATDKPTTDRPVTDRPVRDKPVTDRPVKDRPEPDRCNPRLVDEPRRCIDEPDSDVRPIHRCLRLADNPRRCLHIDDSDPINIRQLIWRLINAHEWKLLYRLLHWLVS